MVVLNFVQAQEAGNDQPTYESLERNVKDALREAIESGILAELESAMKLAEDLVGFDTAESKW